MARDRGSRANHSVSGDLSTTHEPLVTNADLVVILAVKCPVVGGETSRFEYVFDGTNLLPGPAAIVRRIIIPLSLVSYVTAMDPFYPQRIFLCCYGLDKLGDSGLIPGHKVLVPIPPNFLLLHVVAQDMWGALL